MATWLHDPDALNALVDEPGPVGHWARLQRLARGLTTPLPADAITAGPLLALRPPDLDAWVEQLDAHTVGPLQRAVLHLGVGPVDADRWVAPLARLLDGPGAAAAADVLLAIGRLTRAHLGRAARVAGDAPTVPAWVLAVAPAGQRDATAAELAERLRADLAAGAPITLASSMLLQGGHLGSAPADPLAAAERGVRLATGGDGALEVSLPKGSARGQAAALVEALSDGLDGPLVSLIRAIARLRKGPPVPAAAVMMLAWRSRFVPTGEPLTDARRGARGWSVVGRAREAIDADPGPIATPTDAALHAARLRGPAGRASADALIASDPFDEGNELARFAAAAMHPDVVASLLDQPGRRDEGIALASLAPTEEVLERLLRLPIPAHPGDRRNLGWALARMGTPATLPNLRALRGHLPPAAVSEVSEQVRSILGQEL